MCTEAAPTVVGSHMSLLRPLIPRMSTERRKGKPGEVRDESRIVRCRTDILLVVRDLWPR